MSNPSPHVICFGEVLWDVYPQGKKLGGAPFNVAAHLIQLGQKAYMISRIGKDGLGDEIKLEIKNKKIPLSTIQIDEEYRTGTVDVLLDEYGKPSYKINFPAAWDFIQYTESISKLVSNAAALIYGSLSCRNRVSYDTLFQLINQAPKTICDLNIRQGFYSKPLIEKLIQSASILKINDDEALLLSQLFSIDLNNLYVEVSERYQVEIIIQTLGAKGAELFSNGSIIQAPGLSIDVKDTVGSGDAFLAGFIHSYLQGKELETALNKGCELGAFVATQWGAIPEIDINFLNR